MAGICAHWGNWLRERSRAVGILRLADLAGEIGCTPNQLSRWLASVSPPARMLKGFDCALARALKTDRRTLFSGFAQVDPSDAPVLDEPNDRPGDDLRSEIKSAIESMEEPSLRVVRATAMALAETGAHAA